MSAVQSGRHREMGRGYSVRREGTRGVSASASKGEKSEGLPLELVNFVDSFGDLFVL